MSYQVVIEPLGETIEVEEEQTILDAALRAGIYIPHACGHGLCSTCKIDVLEGDVEHGDASPFALMDIERDEGKTLACCAIPTSDLVIEADIDEDVDAESHLVRDFTGVVTKIDTFSPRIKGIFIAIEDDGIEFQAGQYINLKIPGLGDEYRAFSIASPPSENNLVELNVCLVKGGKGTEWLHTQLKVGDELKFSGPYGRFHAHTSEPGPMLFLAGGSGLSCMKSIILDLMQKGEKRPITLMYGARNQDELYYWDLFRELDDEYSNFTYVPILSDEPKDSAWTGLRGLVPTVADEYYEGQFSGKKAYMCGPPPMIDACITTLMRGRLFERDMFMENFYTEADRDTKPASPLFKSI
ncbi:MAG: 2Fe-2S iron-sulfur cluster binding domain-containing protein [Proteobacteria bacterium]|nr:2Fe-2S iron-sulfur cluster binding domain-containing protein [Pseudomonadota bacterium]